MFDEIKDAIVTGNEEKAKELARSFLDRGIKPVEILKEGLIAGMEIVGQRFKTYDMYLPEVLMSATAMKSTMKLLKPLLSQFEGMYYGKIVMATIEGDVHDIGKNLVSMMLEGAGFEIIDLGVDVPVRKIIETYLKEHADLIGISTLLTTTMMALEDAIKIIRENTPKAKVMVGGAPLTKEFSDKIGADGFAPDALRAIHLAKSLMKG
jgi:5-methyltetrahydrofolate--homocysteine methyltransferase